MGFNKGGAVMSKAAIQSLCWECESLFDCPKKDNKLPNFAEYVSAENTMCNSSNARFYTLERVTQCKYFNKPIPPEEQNNYTEPLIRDNSRYKDDTNRKYRAYDRWSQDKLQRLFRYYEQGLSYDEIAVKFGVTRGQVVKKLYNLKRKKQQKEGAN